MKITKVKEMLIYTHPHKEGDPVAPNKPEYKTIKIIFDDDERVEATQFCKTSAKQRMIF